MSKESVSLKDKETFKYLRKNWRYFRKYKGKLALYFLFNFLSSIIGAALPIINAKLVTSITSNIVEQILYFGIIYFITEFVVGTIGFLGNKVFFKFYGRVLLDVRRDLCQNILELESREFDTHGSGVFTKRIETDAQDLGYIFTSINNAFSSALTNVGIFILIFFINLYVGIFYLLGVVVIFFVQRARINNRNRIYKEYREIRDKNAGIYNELVRGVRDIKVLNIKKKFIEKVNDELEESYNKGYKLDTNNQFYWFIDGGVRRIIRILFIVLGIYLIKIGNLVVANFLILFMYQDKIYNLINSFSEMAGDLKDFNLAASRVFEVIDGTGFKKESFGPREIEKITGNITFDHVSFGYSEDRKIINDMEFRVKANERIAFVGKSGGGKTTIFSLLTKLYDATKGQILIDGIDIKELSKDSLRNNISVIMQNPYIFNFSIKENLRLVNPHISDEEIMETCKVACLHDYIMTLPDKYDTLVGEGGVTLSGGQKQRLAIARALIKNSEIILLDEATSALDNETQKEIQQAIKNISKKYTILIIAHRLSTVIDCDKILVVDDGKIVAEGKHEELLQSCSLYKTLYETNFE